MKRLSPLELDKKDMRLLYLIDTDGRLTYSQLARKAQLSKQVVRYRIERLEKEGFIKGYFAMIDTSRLGYTTFRVYLKFRNLSPSKKEEILKNLKKESKIWAVVLIAGKWDVALGIAVKDIYEFYSVWEDILKNYLENIGNYAISIYSPIYHYSKSYLIEKEDDSPVRILGGKDRAGFDLKDLKLLTELSRNARISSVELAHKMKMTAEAISYRIKQLEKKGVIQGYRAMIDVSKLGYEFYKAEIRLSNYDSVDQIINFCHNHPNIYQIDKTIGGETLEIELHVKSLKEMLDIFDIMEKKFPETIEKFDYITVVSEEKTTYMPEI